MNTEGKTKIRLRRINPGLISQNIQHMQLRTKKKRIAQAIYYGEYGVSPLKRVNVKQPKQPVHERLGIQQLQKRHLNLYGTSTSSILPKKRQTFKRSNSRMLFVRNTVNNRVQKLYRVGRVQNRLGSVHNRIGMVQNLVLQNRNNTVPNSNFANRGAGQQIRLRRNFTDPANLQVQVNNTVPFRHSIKSQLNMRLQKEIQLIQQKTTSMLERYEFNEPLAVNATSIYTNDRFSQLG